MDCASHRYPDGSMGIHDMCFYIKPAEIVAICGANGSGKSTLLEHLNGLLLPTSGHVYVMGRPFREKKDTIWRQVGLVFQRPEDQLFAPTVLDDVMFGPINLGMSKEEAREVAISALEHVGVSDLVDKMPNYLSGGQKRLVAIAGVLAMRPKIICMDEPTSDLDEVHSRRIVDIIEEMRRFHGISVVISTHDLNLASRIADRVCIVREGSIIADGQPRDVFYDRELIEYAGLSLPAVVELYYAYCERMGLRPDRRPLTVEELLDALTARTCPSFI
ncbi:energy-coupling factor ABC transporter ATP-binding protein [Methanocella arvoryzae]|uniref:ABC-type transport system, ATPase component n=1 Tax=Methanocella arvoryzae (strain DSM 22066 / NBRC 105507 / MRE50) TaxID=351160 RepID=Q0W3R4_METAR|nr:ABC-type transport system, ATPase component [Methanocella arvoryzae MRE50]